MQYNFLLIFIVCSACACTCCIISPQVKDFKNKHFPILVGGIAHVIIYNNLNLYSYAETIIRPKWLFLKRLCPMQCSLHIGSDQCQLKLYMAGNWGHSHTVHRSYPSRAD